MNAEINGIALDYQLGGSGRLIAFAHSLGMSGAIFDSIRPKLERHGQVLTWDARGQASGVYIIKMNSDGFSQSQKVMLIK